MTKLVVVVVLFAAVSNAAGALGEAERVFWTGRMKYVARGWAPNIACEYDHHGARFWRRFERHDCPLFSAPP